MKRPHQPDAAIDGQDAAPVLDAEVIAAAARDAIRRREEKARMARQNGALGGRPATLTFPLVQQIAREIGFGMTHRTACARHGVNYDTWQSALKRNPRFALAVEQQNAEWLYDALNRMQMDLPGAVSLRWLAERRFEEFRKVEVSVETHHTNNFQMSPEMQEQVAQYARRLDMGLKGGGK